MKKRKTDAVMFDLDGTLWDAGRVTAETWQEMFRRHPELHPAMEMDEQAVRTYMGLTMEELAAVFFPDLTPEQSLALIEEDCELEIQWLTERGGILFPQLRETLEALKKRGFRLFIVSNCQDGYIESFLTAHNMYDYFEDWTCIGKTGLEKADNICLLMQRHGLHAPVYVGDTISDRNGARGAGIPFIYCLYGCGEACGRGRTDDYDEAIHSLPELCDLLTPLSPPNRTNPEK